MTGATLINLATQTTSSCLENVHLAQAINYLEAYNLEIGLLINFGETSLKIKRLTNKKYKS
jgi:GxxExxY protein